MNVEFWRRAWQNGSAVKKTLSALFRTVLLVTVFSFLGCSKTALERNSVIIGLQPNEKSSDHQAFAKDLSSRVGIDIQIVISKDYDDLVQKFKTGEIDFAFFSPLNFLSAERTADAKVLLKKVYGKSEFYYSAILVRKDSNIKSLKNLSGKKIAYVDKKSTSGYLYPRAMLRKAGLEVSSVHPEFAGTHDLAVKALVDGKVDAAGVWADLPENGGGAWTNGENKVGDKVRVLAYSDPIPNDAFVVRKAYFNSHEENVFKIMNALIDMSEKGENSLKKAFDTDKMATATSRHYDSVRAAEKEMDGK
jgi:phosphonate transport system substrate-binding protein